MYDEPDVLKEYDPKRNSTKKQKRSIKEKEPEIPVFKKPDVIPHPNSALMEMPVVP